MLAVSACAGGGSEGTIGTTPGALPLGWDFSGGSQAQPLSAGFPHPIDDFTGVIVTRSADPITHEDVYEVTDETHQYIVRQKYSLPEE